MINLLCSPLFPSPQSPINLTKIEARLDNLENNLNSVQTSLHSVTQNLSTQIENLAKSQVQTNSQVSSLAQALETFIKAQTPSKSSNSNDSNGGAASSSTIEQIKNPPLNLPEITTLQESKKSINFNKRIVTADLESMIEPTTGENLVYMASWYNGETYNTFDVSQFGYDSGRMLSYYWEDLIKANRGKICYFHNWGGYDSILSLTQLLNLPKNYVFNPVMKDGEMMSLTISQGTVTILTIKDSLRIIPGALGKLAIDWKIDTEKEHFPHYFWVNDMKSTLAYKGALPPYETFEPKRTTRKDYEEMVEEFKNQTWSFLEVSRTYILSDVKALYQILIAFFETLVSKFPIDPLTVLSAPSTAFKIWRTVQLPKLNKEFKVYDLSKNLDSKFREGYLGGIVDVYRPHLIGQTGYYYDVNSLYPTAMCKPMPVGLPQLVNLTIGEFLSSNFFGFIEATVKAPSTEYIGLLPIKLQGKLICPGGTFSGFFFSEEFKFALDHGYQLIEIKLAYKFEKGINTFLDLITTLNEMKVDDILICTETFRLSRSLLELLIIVDDLLRKGNFILIGYKLTHYISIKYSILGAIILRIVEQLLLIKE